MGPEGHHVLPTAGNTGSNTSQRPYPGAEGVSPSFSSTSGVELFRGHRVPRQTLRFRNLCSKTYAGDYSWNFRPPWATTGATSGDLR